MRRHLAVALAACLFAAAASAGEKVVLRFGLETSRSDTQYKGATAFAKYVKDKTGGNVEIKLFPDSALGSTTSLRNQVRSGTIDFHMSGSGNYAGLMAALNVFDVPFLFKDTDHVDRVMDGEIGRAILDTAEEHDIKGLALWENGFRSLTNSRNEVKTPDDVAGLKIRVPTMPMHVEAWRLLGANPIPMDYSEVFTALETKAIDAQDHPISVTFSARFYESQKFLSVTHHAYTPLILVMNLQKFNSLSPEYQQIILEGAHLGAVTQRKLVRDGEVEFIGKIRDYGLQVVEKKDLDMKPWQDKVSSGMEEFIGKIPEAVKWLKPIQDAAE